MIEVIVRTDGHPDFRVELPFPPRKGEYIWTRHGDEYIRSVYWKPVDPERRSIGRWHVVADCGLYARA